MFLAYCAGLIGICTGLLIVATTFTIQNYWMLRRLSDGSPGKHDASVPDPDASAPALGEKAQRRFEHYDSGPPTSGDIEWTGPVTAYTPPDRGAR